MTTTSVIQVAKERNYRLLKTLIKSKCLLDEISDRGFTALMIAIRNNDIKCLDILVRGGVNIDFVNQIGRTALIYAAQQQNVMCLKRLIKAGANLELADETGITALTASVFRGNVECISILIKAGASLNTRFYDDTILTVSLLHENVDLLKLLITAGANVDMTDTRGYTALMAASEKGLENHLKMLLEAGASTNICNNDGDTALMLCVDNDQIKCLQLLISAGASVNIPNQKGENSLIKAVHKRELTSAFHLLKAGVDLNFKDSISRTVLMHILMENDVHTIGSVRNKLFIRLIEYGADVNGEDEQGMTTLDYALKGNLVIPNPIFPGKIPEENCVQMILSHGGNLNQICERERIMQNSTAELCEQTLTNTLCLLRKKAKTLNAKNNTGITALMDSIIKGDHANFKTLILAGADINTQDDRGNTALIYAVRQDSTRTAEYKTCEMLVNYGADVNAQNNNGMTALMFAAKCPKWNTNVTDLLIQNGANLELTDNLKMTALIHILDDTSSLKTRLERATWLLKNGANPLLGCYRKLLARAVSSYAFARNQSRLRYCDINKLIDGGFVEIIRCVVCNGLVPENCKTCDSKNSPPCNFSPFVYALINNRTDIAKYFIANFYLTEFDVQHITGQYIDLYIKDKEDDTTKETLSFVGEVYSNPWPLVKLAFIAVSTALGSSPARDERITETPLPNRLKEMLRFQEPVSLLCVHQWPNIPVHPLDYYKQSSAKRPLLYYWPGGQIQPLLCDHYDCSFKRRAVFD